MARTPRLSGKDLIRLLRKNGFTVLRVRGSHHFMEHLDGHSTVVPVHAGETLGIGLLTSILRDVEWTSEDLIARMR